MVRSGFLVRAGSPYGPGSWVAHTLADDRRDGEAGCLPRPGDRLPGVVIPPPVGVVGTPPVYSTNRAPGRHADDGILHRDESGTRAAC